MRIGLIATIALGLIARADAPPMIVPDAQLPHAESHMGTMPPPILEFEACIRSIQDERSAAHAAAQVEQLVPRLKELLTEQTWQNAEEALILAQILNTAFNLLLTEPPCYGSQELEKAIGDLLSLFTQQQIEP